MDVSSNRMRKKYQNADVFFAGPRAGNLTMDSEGAVCSTMLHEFMHWSGSSHGADKTGRQGTDQIYSCSRYCGGCNELISPAFLHPCHEFDTRRKRGKLARASPMSPLYPQRATNRSI